MLAICSDLDETPDRFIYFEIMKYLNTPRLTVMGDGVGLEVGNTIYFDMPANQFAYWNTDDAGRYMVRSLIQSGHIDCFHSYGDLATTRHHAERALAELTRYNCRLEVWIDHGIAPSNFGGDIMRGSGDVLGSPVYHADLACDFGVRYVWRGRVTSVIGQDVPRSMSGIGNWHHPLASGKTVAKELSKGWLARIGYAKYAMNATNKVMCSTQLRSGQPVWEFLRANPHWGGVSSSETADGLADVLTESMLSRLVKQEGACVLYTHLGKISNYDEPFGPKTREALKRLARYVSGKNILVTTTRRLLGYHEAVRAVQVSSARDGEQTIMNVTIEGREADLNGLTLYVPEPERVQLRVNGREIDGLYRNAPDETGRASVSVPWRPLVFPEL